MLLAFWWAPTGVPPFSLPLSARTDLKNLSVKRPIHVSGHDRQKPDRFTQPVIDTAAKLLAAIDAEYVRALEVGLADFSGE
ncbi:hypothetical protein BKD03_07265 [Brucella sp. 09RB8471]|nr:hypothetical protein BKD03_07265 [Brucella sp. 09RB8471]